MLGWVGFTASCTLIILYMVMGDKQEAPWSTLAAILVKAAYLILLVLPPHPTLTAGKLGPAFGLVPLVSFGAILFPELNTAVSTTATRLFGWFGLIFCFAALALVKAFVW
ncbi:MAG: hypothetical protein LAT63_04425 [Marinobacter sp.]|nr:hypothetical protein [Marinobacter sp.]